MLSDVRGRTAASNGSLLERVEDPTGPLAAADLPAGFPRHGASPPQVPRTSKEPLRTRKNVESAGDVVRLDGGREDLASAGTLVTMTARATVGRSEPSPFGNGGMADRRVRLP